MKEEREDWHMFNSLFTKREVIGHIPRHHFKLSAKVYTNHKKH